MQTSSPLPSRSTRASEAASYACDLLCVQYCHFIKLSLFSGRSRSPCHLPLFRHPQGQATSCTKRIASICKVRALTLLWMAMRSTSRASIHSAIVVVHATRGSRGPTPSSRVFLFEKGVKLNEALRRGRVHRTFSRLRPWLLGYHPPSAPGFSRKLRTGNKMVTREYF